MSDRVGVVRDGQIIHIDKASRLTEYQLIGMASGVGVSDEIEEWMDLRKIAFPHLQNLRDTTNIPAHLAVLDRREMTLFYLDKVGFGSTEMMSLTGASDPLHCTGLGKVLLAYEPFEKVQEWVADISLPRFTENTLTDPDDFLAEIQTTRQQGYALDREEHDLGERSIAVPLADAQGEVIAAISITGLAELIPLDETNAPLREAIMQTAEKISTEYASREI
jgi:DNA-binding IclR family transcriptional regulator